MSTAEFVALAASLTCLTALSIDIMLPVLPQLAVGLGISDPNDRQWVITAYLVGLVVGQLFVGTLSDRNGRLPVLLGGLALFVLGAAIASGASTFQWLLIARFVQGVGGAAPRVIVMAVVRDLFEGRQMARIMSLVMTTFIMVPVFAPMLGQLLAAIGGWRAPIASLAVAGTLATVWAWARLPETSPRHNPGDRGATDAARPPIAVKAALRVVLSSRTAIGYTVATGAMFACLMSYILSSQQVFVDIYNLGGLFPLAFGGIALAMAFAGILNARIVVRLGMRHVSHRALLAFIVCASIVALVSIITAGRPPFWFLWVALWLQFFCFGLVVSNFNAIAIEPLGAVAGTASSVMGAFTTLISSGLGAIVGQAFDMTTLPINLGFVIFSGSALIIILITEGVAGFGREPAA